MALGFWGFGKVICKLTNAVEVKGNKMVQFSSVYCAIPIRFLHGLGIHAIYDVPHAFSNSFACCLQCSHYFSITVLSNITFS
jgi:hypothetical protein